MIGLSFWLLRHFRNLCIVSDFALIIIKPMLVLVFVFILLESWLFVSIVVIIIVVIASIIAVIVVFSGLRLLLVALGLP